MVFSGKGKKLLQVGGVGDDADQKQMVENAYFQPDMHPDHRRFVAVRCAGFPTDWEAIIKALPSCDLAQLATDGPEEETLYTPPAGAWVYAPVWSPSGDHIAFFEDRDILVWSRDGIHRIPNAIDRGWRPFSNHETSLAWESRGEKLFVNGEVPGRAGKYELPMIDVGQVNVESKVVDWLNLHEFHFTYGKYSRDGMVFVEDRGRFLPRPKQMPDLPATRALFGSAENPVLRPMWGPGRSFYFYETLREGGFGSSWIEGYEIESGRTFHVRTLERWLYRV